MFCVNGSFVPDAYALAKIGRIGVQIHPFRPIDEGLDEVRDGFLALFEISPELSSVMAAPHIRIVGDVAWVSGLEKFRRVLSSGDVVEETLRTGRIFEREGEGWLVAHHQVSPPPDE